MPLNHESRRTFLKRTSAVAAATIVPRHVLGGPNQVAPSDRVNVALVGADAIAVDGSVINKAGTYLLALAAQDRGIPLYVCFESFKRSKLGAADIPLEQHDASEFAPPELPNITPHNIYFDITPVHLVTAWITETGMQRKFSPKTA